MHPGRVRHTKPPPNGALSLVTHNPRRRPPLHRPKTVVNTAQRSLLILKTAKLLNGSICALDSLARKAFKASGRCHGSHSATTFFALR